MASIRQIAQDILPDARDAIAWIALYKRGRSWHAECVWGLYDDQTDTFATDYPWDIKQLREILDIDPNAIFVNPWYHNLGPIDDEMTRDTLANALRWQYDKQYNRLTDISIVYIDEPEPGRSAETTATGGSSAGAVEAAEPCNSTTATGSSPIIPSTEAVITSWPVFCQLLRHKKSLRTSVRVYMLDIRQRPPPRAPTPRNERSA